MLRNLPLGRKSALTFTNGKGQQKEEDLVYNRQAFWTISSNKQISFIQQINTLLKPISKAVVVVRDNVLEGGAGEIIRKKLLETCELHTIGRLTLVSSINQSAMDGFSELLTTLKQS